MPTLSDLAILDYRKLCGDLGSQIESLFSDFESGIAAREDSRAFGAMIEHRIGKAWKRICKTLHLQPFELPGRRTIFDFACSSKDIVLGIDVKTKDLDSNRYSDGGVCAVGNLLKFLANDKGVFLIAEFGHTQSVPSSSSRDLEYIKVAPFHCLPISAYRIENLGTGQVRLNYSINQLWEEIQWERSYVEFFNIFTDLAIKHYERVGRDALKRVQSMKEFKKNNYERFHFVR